MSFFITYHSKKPLLTYQRNSTSRHFCNLIVLGCYCGSIAKLWIHYNYIGQNLADNVLRWGVSAVITPLVADID